MGALKTLAASYTEEQMQAFWNEAKAHDARATQLDVKVATYEARAKAHADEGRAHNAKIARLRAERSEDSTKRWKIWRHAWRRPYDPQGLAALKAHDVVADSVYAAINAEWQYAKQFNSETAQLNVEAAALVAEREAIIAEYINKRALKTE
jgi:hypothetical protein